MRKLLFSDFDGVLFDTIKEAYIICRHAFADVDYSEKIDERKYKNFYRFKFLVYNSWQYYYLMKLLNENISDDELITKYNIFMNNRDLQAEKSFDKKYYASREELMQKYHDFWDKLEAPFEFFYLVKNAVETKKLDLVIVSKKNKPAIIYRLEQYGLRIPHDKIFGKDELTGYSTKADFMSEYMQKYNIGTAYFVDDNSHNLTPCKKYHDIIPLLAGWGNIKLGETGLTNKEVMDTLLK